MVGAISLALMDILKMVIPVLSAIQIVRLAMGEQQSVHHVTLVEFILIYIIANAIQNVLMDILVQHLSAINVILLVEIVW